MICSVFNYLVSSVVSCVAYCNNNQSSKKNNQQSKENNNRMHMLLSFVCCASVLLTHLVHAEHAQEAFLHANALYEAGEYAQACDRYNLLVPTVSTDSLFNSVASNVASSSVWFNIGNCAYKNGAYFDAVIAWKRSQKYSSAQTFFASEKNIDHAIRAAGVYIDNLWYKKLFIKAHRYILGCALTVSLFCWQLIILLSWVLLMILVSHRHTVIGYSLIGYRMIFGMLVCLNFVCFLGLWARKDHLYPVGIVLSEHALVYAGPDNGYHTIGEYSQLSTVKIDAEHGDMYKISGEGKTGDSIVGWIARKEVERV